MEKEKLDTIMYNQPFDVLVKRVMTSVEELSKKYNVDMTRMKKTVDDLSTGEELQRLRSELAEVRKMMVLGFPVTTKERATIDVWRKDGRENHKFEYRFLPTGIGTVGKIVDLNTGDELDFTDYSVW